MLEPRSRGFPAGLLDQAFLRPGQDEPECQSPFQRAYLSGLQPWC